MGEDVSLILFPVKFFPSISAKGPLKENALVIFLIHLIVQVEEFYFQIQVPSGFPTAQIQISYPQNKNSSSVLQL